MVGTATNTPRPIWSKRSTTSGSGSDGSSRDPREAATALDAVSEPVFVLDREHRVVRVNRAACERLDLDVDALLGRPCYRLVHDSDCPIEGCPHESLLVDGLPHTADLDVPKLGGRVRVHCVPLTDSDGHLAGCAHVTRSLDDGDARPRHEDRSGDATSPQLRSATGSLEAGPLLDAMPELFAILDPQMRILWVNDAAAGEARRSREGLLGRRCYEVLHGADAPCPDCAAVASLQTRTPAESERRGEGDRYFLHRAYPVIGDDGTVSALVALTQDVTARRLTEIAMAESATRTRAALQASVRAMGAVIELRDPDTARHQRNVAGLAQALADEMELPHDVAESLWYAGQLLDIGKLAVPIDILGRPGALSETERMLVRVHPQAAARVLRDIPFDLPVARAVAQHHERLDGSGYPEGLAGDEIALEARVLAVADVVTAMRTHRPHRAALRLDDVMTEMRRGAGTEFDREVVEALERLVERGELPEVE